MANGLAGAPIGNRNGAKGRDWQDALRKALIQYEDHHVPQGQALYKIATKVVAQAIQGDPVAWQEIGNRLDGKAAQSLTVSGDADAPMITAIKMILIDANSLISKDKEIVGEIIENDSQLEIVEISSQSSEVVPPLPPSVILGEGGGDI